MGCVTYRVICEKCGYDRFVFKRPDAKCPMCLLDSVEIIPEFDEQDDHGGSMKTSDDGTKRWCK